MPKGILPIFAGMATAMLVIFLMEFISHSVYPIPQGVNLKNKEDLIAMINGMPLGAFCFILLGYAFGSFSGGLVAAMLSTEKRIRTSLIVGTVVMLGGVMNIIMIPHPMWFTIATFFAYLPFAYLAGYIVQKAKTNV